jgi:hypothetical protein
LGSPPCRGARCERVGGSPPCGGDGLAWGGQPTAPGRAGIGQHGQPALGYEEEAPDHDQGVFTGQSRRSKRSRVQRGFTELSSGSKDNFSDYESDEDIASAGDPLLSSVRDEFQDHTWSQEFFIYDPKPRKFTSSRGPTTFFVGIPTLLQLFDLFWPCTLLHKIVVETNRYATHPLDAQGKTMEGPKWKNLIIAELKAFFAIHMYVGMKRQPNVKSYWKREGSFFHCPTVSNIMTMRRFKELIRCLHITDPATYEHIPSGDPVYDKIRQVRWLIEEIRSACMREWSLGEFLTIDEMIIRYNGTYCPIRQYMPKKPEKWSIKF